MTVMHCSRRCSRWSKLLACFPLFGDVRNWSVILGLTRPASLSTSIYEARFDDTEDGGRDVSRDWPFSFVPAEVRVFLKIIR